MSTPRVEIDLNKIAHNTRALRDLYGADGIQISAVTKVVCGDPQVAAMLVACGMHTLADSRLANIRRMRAAGVDARFLLLRGPSPSQVDEVVALADQSLNTDLSVIRELSRCAVERRCVHEIILMIESGDLREGVLPSELPRLVEQVSTLEGVSLVGIGTNLACFGGIMPDAEKMGFLSDLARDVEDRFDLRLNHVSGGNSANYEWFVSTEDHGRITDLRIGESIYLGCETLARQPIPGLHTDAFTLIAEVIESRIKPSVPYGRVRQNAAGSVPRFADRGASRRVIVALGFQDVSVAGLTPPADLDILGASGDHTILDGGRAAYRAGDEIAFGLDYAALLSAMSSPSIEKVVL